MKTIPLSKGYYAIVDDEDYENVIAYKWCVKLDRRADNSLRVYAQRKVKNSRGIESSQGLQRFILGTPSGMTTDYVNGNTLDNRRSNLRVCTRAKSTQNQVKHTILKTSKFKGVSWCQSRNKWQVHICINRKRVMIGRFEIEEEAARAYDSAAIKSYGEFARPNFPGGSANE